MMDYIPLSKQAIVKSINCSFGINEDDEFPWIILNDSMIRKINTLDCFLRFIVELLNIPRSFVLTKRAPVLH